MSGKTYASLVALLGEYYPTKKKRHKKERSQANRLYALRSGGFYALKPEGVALHKEFPAFTSICISSILLEKLFL